MWVVLDIVAQIWIVPTLFLSFLILLPYTLAEDKDQVIVKGTLEILINLNFEYKLHITKS